MTADEIRTAIDSLAQAAAALLAVSVTVVTVVPTLVEVARSRSPSFLSGEMEQKQLRKAVSALQIATALSSLSIICWVVFLLVPAEWLVPISATMVGVTTLCICVASLLGGKAVHKALRD